jgi:hypothetical protein
MGRRHSSVSLLLFEKFPRRREETVDARRNAPRWIAPRAPSAAWSTVGGPSAPVAHPPPSPTPQYRLLPLFRLEHCSASLGFRSAPGVPAAGESARTRSRRQRQPPRLPTQPRPRRKRPRCDNTHIRQRWHAVHSASRLQIRNVGREQPIEPRIRLPGGHAHKVRRCVSARQRKPPQTSAQRALGAGRAIARRC